MTDTTTTAFEDAPIPPHVLGEWVPDPDDETIESLCGISDFQDVEQYDGTLGPTREFVRRYGGSTCRIRFDEDLSEFAQPGRAAGRSRGTGTLVGPNLVLTAAHLFEEPDEDGLPVVPFFPVDDDTGETVTPARAAENMHVQFDFQVDPNGSMRSSVDVAIAELVEIRPNGLDVALLRLAESPGPRFGWREAAERSPIVSEPLTIIQHPAGRPKQIEAGTAGRLFSNTVGYGDIDTLPGSSGSGVLDRLGRLVAVHVAGGCDDTDHRRNYGVRLDRVLTESTRIREAVSRIPRIDIAGGESCVAAWADDPDRNGFDNISLATIGRDGGVDRRSDEWNTQHDGHQIRPRVAAAGPHVVVTWEDDADENDFANVLVAAADRSHRHRFLPREAHGNGRGQQLAPDVGVAADGTSVVVWQDDNDENGYYNIHARGLNADGSRRFGDAIVNRVGAGQQFAPRVAVASDGDFVVVWEDDRDRNDHLAIMARRFHSDGTPAGDDFLVNARRWRYQQLAPSVSISSNGRVIGIAWEDDMDNNAFFNVRLRLLDGSSGATLLSERQAHANGAGQQRRPAILVRDDGSHVVAWEDDADRNGFTNVLVRSAASDGSERFLLHAHRVADGHQRNPAVTELADGTIVVGLDEDRDLDGHYEPLVCGISPAGDHLWETAP